MREWRDANPEKFKEQQKRKKERQYKNACGFPNKWISVSDFLPDVGKWVLVHVDLEEEPFVVCFWDGESWKNDSWDNAPVMHWARLPEPPAK